MLFDQMGYRITLLQKLLNEITGVYNLARERGIPNVEFLNETNGKKNVTTQNVKTVVEGHDYGGTQRVGTELKRKILDRFVLGTNMKKPMLVIVITDRAVRLLNPSRSLYMTNPNPPPSPRASHLLCWKQCSRIASMN